MGMKRIALMAVLALVAGATADVLFNGGPLVNYPGQGFGGYDASAIQTTLLENVYGYGHWPSSDRRVADDFTITDAGGWQIDTAKFFAYQTGSGTTSTINHVNVRIWSGTPGSGGTVVWGDTTTNRLASTGWSQIYRSISTSLTATNRPIMGNVANIGTTLGPGTYWMDWQTGGTLTSGPWAPPVSILDVTGPPDANAKQWNPTTSTWGPVMDTGNSTPDAMPFILNGTVIPEPASLLLLGLAALLRRR
jgi:hypothetical protein